MGRKSRSRFGRMKNEGIHISAREEYSDNDFPFQEKMHEYIANIIERYDINNKMMEFIFISMDVRERRDFINLTYAGSIPPEENRHNETNEYYHVISDLHDPSHISDHIVSDLYGGKLTVKDHIVEKFAVRHLRAQMSRYRKRNKKGFNGRIRELRSIFSLDDAEIEALLYLYCMYESNTEFLKSYRNEETYYDVLRMVSAAIMVPLPSVKRILSKHGRLFLCGIIARIDSTRSDYFSLNEAITEYLAGISDVTLLDQFVRPDRGDFYDLSSFSIDTDVIDTIVSLLSSPGRSNIFLYGIAGTGKTEFARSLARAAGRKAFFLQFGEGDMTKRSYSADDEGRHLALSVAINSIDPAEGVIIADEADMILNRSMNYYGFSGKPTGDKGSLNYFLDTSTAKIIWISNEIFRMEESTLRRFSYSLYFGEFSYSERQNIWNNLLDRHPLKRYISPTLIEDLSYRYQVNAGGIGSALEALSVIYRSRKPYKEGIEKKLRDLLDRHERIIHGKYHKERKTFNDLTLQYDPDAVNMDGDPGMALAAVIGFARRMKKEEDLKNTNVNMLFWGAPGTGKTEYARYLAAQSGLRLIVKRASDILSPWVGVTEQNIASAFREARDSRAILFIDEADTLLYGRESAIRSWEASMTNEFLTQMENHVGILICCTNLLASVDRAALRRFNFKFEFRPLTKDGKLLLYRKYFTLKGKRLSPEMKQRIMDIPDLTPGDFRAVQLKLGHHAKDLLTHEQIINELENESRYKKKGNMNAIGF